MIKVNIEVGPNTRKNHPEKYFFRATTMGGKVIGKAYYNTEQEAMTAGAALMSGIFDVLTADEPAEQPEQPEQPEQVEQVEQPAEEPQSTHTVDELMEVIQPNSYWVVYVLSQEEGGHEKYPCKIQVTANEKIEAAAIAIKELSKKYESFQIKDVIDG